MKTLVFDLDETLVFSSLEATDDADHVLSIAGQTVYVQVRPGALAIARTMRELFACRVWSTGQPIYVEAVCAAMGLEWMEIWGRDRCRRLDAIPENHFEPYDKPLHLISQDLAKIVIVDNAPGAFNCNPENGIPINTWRGDPEDRQLFHLTYYLRWLHHLPDMRRDHRAWPQETVILRNERRCGPLKNTGGGLS